MAEDPGAWDPSAHIEESVAEMDADDPAVDCLLPSDDEDMGNGVADSNMMEALLNAGVNEDDAIHFLRAIHKTKKKKPITGGSKSDRAGDRHSGHCESKPRTSDPKAAPVVKSGRASPQGR